MTSPTGAGTVVGSGTTSGTTRAAAQGELAADTLKALGVALNTEYAAVWAYGIVAANDQKDVDLINTIANDHLARRDETIDMISSGGGKPAGAAAAYKLPMTVNDAKSAQALATVIESDCAAAWRAVVGTTDDPNLRTTAVQALTDSANALTRLKLAAKTAPATVPFPGMTDG